MTKPEVLEKWGQLTPRERDAWIALDITKIGTPIKSAKRRKEQGRDVEEHWMLIATLPGCIGYPKLPHYTTDTALAMDLFVNMMDTNRTSIEPCGNSADGLWWQICYDRKVVAWDCSLPKAIGKFALIVFHVGYEEGSLPPNPVEED
jgi:hypothetical protein